MSYTEDLKNREAEIAAVQRANDDQQAWLFILRQFPLVAHDANFKIVREYCDPEPVSVEGFRSLLNNAEFTQQLDWDQKSERERLVHEIMLLLRNHGPRMTSYDLTSEEKKLRYQTVQQLRNRLQEIQARQTAAGKTVPQLQADLKEARKDQRRYPGFPNLPKEIVPEGQVKSVICDARYLRNLDSYMLRRYLQKYGDQQINDALRER